MLPEQQQRILGYFIEEARDHLNTIEQGLLNLQSTLNDQEMINEVFRAAHSIKGGAAMLGLSSIQHTSHRLEDCFKILKENPIQVDQKLESLFLGVADTLKALLENLSGPFGLSQETANTLMSETEPVFQWLNDHLELLVQQANNGVSSTPAQEINPAFADHSHTLTEIFMPRDFSTPEEDNTKVSPEQRTVSVVKKANDNWNEFQAQVLQTLREMLQLFKQGTTVETRQNLQECCHQLVDLGETFNLPKWCDLCEAVENAIANPENTYLTLAKIVITEIKKAQELVLKGQEAEIVISQQLEVLLSLREVELFEITSDLPDESTIQPTPSANDHATAIADQLPSPTKDDFVSDTNDSITSLSELSEQLTQHKDIPTTTENSTSETSDFFNFLSSNDHDTLFTNHNLDSKGPEVGIAELNTLADLFEGETPELDETWQQEEILDITSASKMGIDISSKDTEDADSDLADLLFLDQDTSNDESQKTIIQIEDFGQIFSEKFLGKENSQSLPPETSGTNYDVSNISNNDINFRSSTDESHREFTEILQEYPGDIAPQDVVQDLLALELDKNKPLFLGEIAQPETEASASVELSNNVESSLDNLFSETANESLVEEITSINFPQPESLSLDNLFTELGENPLVSPVHSEMGDLFDPQSTIAKDFIPPADDLSNFWNVKPAAKPESEFDSIIEQDVARELEESLFTAAANDFFGDSQSLISSSTGNFDLEDFELTFSQPEQQTDLMFESDAGDDFFADFLSDNTNISPTVDERKLSAKDIRSFVQEESDVYDELRLPPPVPSTALPPEALDFTPEFTNPPTQKAFDVSPQCVPDLETDLFDLINENSEENPQLVFEDITTANLTYIELDTTETIVADTPQLSLGDNLSATASDIEFDFGENFDLEPPPTTPEAVNKLEIAETTVAESEKLDLGEDLFSASDIEFDFAENFDLEQSPTTPEAVNKLEIAETTVAESEELHLGEDLFSASDIEFDFAENLALEPPPTTPEAVNKLEIPETTVAESEELDLGEDLFSASDIGFDFGENLALEPPPTTPEAVNKLEIPETTVAESEELHLGEDLFSASDIGFDFGENLALEPPPTTPEAVNKLEIPETTVAESEELDLGEDLFSASDIEFDFGENFDLEQSPIISEAVNKLEIAETTVAESEELDLGEDLFSASDIEFHFGENFDLEPPPTTPEALNKLEIAETTVAESEELDLGEDLFSASDIGFDFGENFDLEPPPIISEALNKLEIAETTVAESEEFDLIADLIATENILQSEEKQEDLVESTASIQDTNTAIAENVVELNVLDEIQDLSAPLLNIAETDATATITEPKNAVVAQTELDVSPGVTSEDEFAELETLLEEEFSSSLPHEDFAALEALLDGDNHQDVSVAPLPVYPQQLQPPTTYNSASTAVTAPDIDDEFGDLEKLLAEADNTISHSPSIKSNTGKAPRPSTRRGARFEETMKIPVKQLDDMSNLVGELVVNRNTLEQDHERLRQSLDNLLIQVQQLSDVGARMQELYERSLLEASLLATRKHRDTGVPSPDSNADRGFSELEMDRFTPFHTLSQEMIEMIVRVRESASDIDFVTEETERVARQFRQATTQLQEGLTRARMVPFSQAIDRLRRGVRDNAIKYGKQVELVIEGGDTLIDKMILDHLTDPLTHMLNNAIAHGIETPEVRQAALKNPVGEIKIRAFHQGNQTVISVADDGAGIDPERIKAKALKLGMLTAEETKTITRMEVYNLLFHSGFSIKDQADEISGRGVGMDIVRSEISEVRGTVNTDSAIGKGTTFTIRLPLTLSICKALCCVSDKARIAFPMDGVEDTLDIPLKSIQQTIDGQTFIAWRDTVLPFRPLKELLGFNRQISRGSVYGGTRDDDMVSVVVVRSANNLLALQIDLVLSEQEIVIKQFEGPAPKPLGVAGATVLGDGRIMPIADVLEIMDIFQGRMSQQNGVSIWQQKSSSSLPEIAVVKIDPTVLIVDDSITVRELLSLTFNKAGYRVEQARDGQEAWDKLRSGLPCDIVFCDIEMPRCDGLELLSRIQKDHNLNHLPIAMLTSRGADKHKQMAIQLGASGYFTKPYLEEALLEAAVRMLKGEKLILNTTV